MCTGSGFLILVIEREVGILLDNGFMREGGKGIGTLTEARRYKKIKFIIYVNSIIHNGVHNSMLKKGKIDCPLQFIYTYT